MTIQGNISNSTNSNVSGSKSSEAGKIDSEIRTLQKEKDVMQKKLSQAGNELSAAQKNGGYPKSEKEKSCEDTMKTVQQEISQIENKIRDLEKQKTEKALKENKTEKQNPKNEDESNTISSNASDIHISKDKIKNIKNYVLKNGHVELQKADNNLIGIDNFSSSV